MGKAFGGGEAGGAGLLGCSCWVAVPVCFFLLLIPWEQAGVEPWRLGCLAALLKALAHLCDPCPLPGMLVFAVDGSCLSDHGQLLVPPEMRLLAGQPQVSEMAGGVSSLDPGVWLPVSTLPTL